MPFPKKLLTSNEQIVREMRAHWKALIRPVVLTIIVWGAAGFAYTAIGSGPAWIALVVALVLWIVVAGWPILQWRFTEYAITNERLIARSGVIAKHAKEIPLETINDITFTQTLLDRILRAGDLVLESAGERGQQVFNDIGRPEQIQKLIYETAEARKVAFSRGGAHLSVADEIAKLADLRDRGVISSADFEARKAKLLES